MGVDQAIQTEVRLEEEDEQCRSGIELEVTLPMPAPPPRLNRGSSTAAAAAGQTAQAKTSPAEDDTGITGIVYVYVGAKRPLQTILSVRPIFHGSGNHRYSEHLLMVSTFLQI